MQSYLHAGFVRGCHGYCRPGKDDSGAQRHGECRCDQAAAGAHAGGLQAPASALIDAYTHDYLLQALLFMVHLPQLWLRMHEVLHVLPTSRGWPT
jgi:hypothetical protein